jgi:hypothetical protein
MAAHTFHSASCSVPSSAKMTPRTVRAGPVAFADPLAADQACDLRHVSSRTRSSLCFFFSCALLIAAFDGRGGGCGTRSLVLGVGGTGASSPEARVVHVLLHKCSVGPRLVAEVMTLPFRCARNTALRACHRNIRHSGSGCMRGEVVSRGARVETQNTWIQLRCIRTSARMLPAHLRRASMVTCTMVLYSSCRV